MFPLANKTGTSRSSERGSVLMIALLLVLLGTFGITAWFGLIAARSLEVGVKEDAMVRRVQLNGVKEVARQLGSQSFLAMDGGKAANSDIQLATKYGKVSTPPWTGTPYTSTGVLRYDQIGGVPGQSFTTDIVASLDDGQGALGSVDYHLQLRTYVPCLQGDLLTIHEPADPTMPMVTHSNLLVNGRTVVWNGGKALGHRTERLHTSAKASSLALVDLAGNSVMADNEAFAPRSTGSDFLGRTKKVNLSESTANRYTSRLAALGAVTIAKGSTLGDLAIDGYRAYVDAAGDSHIEIQLEHPLLPHLYIESHVGIRLIGQTSPATLTTAGGLAARMIVANNPPGSGTDRNLDLVLDGENSRPILFAISRGVAAHAHSLIVTYDYAGGSSPPTGFPTWRGIFDLENSPVVFDINAGSVSELHIRGGISTDTSLDTSSFPGVRILRDTAPGLEAIASRTGFVEIYRN